MTSPKSDGNIGVKILKLNIYFIWNFIAILFELEKICIFQNCISRPEKCSLCSKYFI